MTGDWREWDWPPRHRPRVEILPPQPKLVRVTIHRRNTTPRQSKTLPA
jgi:hypothetical protein